MKDVVAAVPLSHLTDIPSTYLCVCVCMKARGGGVCVCVCVYRSYRLYGEKRIPEISTQEIYTADKIYNYILCFQI